MNAATPNENNLLIANPVYNPATLPQSKTCTSCNRELVVNDHVNHTSFGLDLCEDCLYS